MIDMNDPLSSDKLLLNVKLEEIFDEIDRAIAYFDSQPKQIAS